jgi:hypothetical protein
MALWQTELELEAWQTELQEEIPELKEKSDVCGITTAPVKLQHPAGTKAECEQTNLIVCGITTSLFKLELPAVTKAKCK